MEKLADILRRRFNKQADAGMLAARAIPEAIEEASNYLTNKAISNGEIKPEDKDKYKKRVSDKMLTEKYRQSRMTSTPVSPLEVGAVGAMNVLPTMGINRVHRLFKPSIPKMGLGGAVASMASPAYLPMSATFEGVTRLLDPLSDPVRKAGRRSYLGSLAQGIGGAADRFGAREEELHKRYNPLISLPLGAYHGINNPLSASVYAGKELKDFLMSKSGALLINKAETFIFNSLQA